MVDVAGGAGDTGLPMAVPLVAGTKGSSISVVGHCEGIRHGR